MLYNPSIHIKIGIPTIITKDMLNNTNYLDLTLYVTEKDYLFLKNNNLLTREIKEPKKKTRKERQEYAKKIYKKKGTKDSYNVILYKKGIRGVIDDHYPCKYTQQEILKMIYTNRNRISIINDILN